MKCSFAKLNSLGISGVNGTNSFVKFAILCPKYRAFTETLGMIEENGNKAQEKENSTNENHSIEVQNTAKKESQTIEESESMDKLFEAAKEESESKANDSETPAVAESTEGPKVEGDANESEIEPEASKVDEKAPSAEKEVVEVAPVESADTEEKASPQDNSDSTSKEEVKAEALSPIKEETNTEKGSDGSHDVVVGEIDEDEDDDHDDSDPSSDEEQDEADAATERIQLPNLESLELSDLLAVAKKLRSEHSMQLIKPYLDEIKHHFFTKAKAERQVKLEEFVSGGGIEIDFEYQEPLREEFKALLDAYRKEREEYRLNLERELNANLKTREDLIEELKGLLQSEEKFSETFNHFRELQEKWRNIGPVPRTASSEIWRTYHHHVENFYDYLRLNDDLRDMDFRKNLEHKQRLVSKAKELAASDDIHAAFKELQGLHTEWKEEGGPVAKEHREPIWEEFSEYTKQIHDKRHAHYDELKSQWEDNLRLREKVCEKIEEATAVEINTHKDWQAKIKEVRGLADAFREVGRVPKGKSTAVWQRFREALLHFNTKKNEFYKELKDAYKANLQDRQNLITKAEELKESNDWRNTADALKKLQQEWKKLGPVGHSDNQKTWKKFREACDHFFTKRKEHFAEQDKEFEDNYTAKEALMAELEAFELPKVTGDAVAKLKEFMSKWREIGFVPRSKMGIDKNWKQLVDLKFDQLKLSGKEKGEARFKNKIEILAAKGGRELNREKETIRREISEAQNELKTLEANIQMLTPTGNKPNPFIATVEKSIETQRKKIEQLRAKLRLVKDVEVSED